MGGGRDAQEPGELAEGEQRDGAPDGAAFGLAGLRGLAQPPGGQQRERHVQQVGGVRGPRAPLREHGGKPCADQESGREAQGGAAGALGGIAAGARGQLRDPRRADGHDQPQRHAAEHAPPGDNQRLIRGDGQQEGTDERQRRRGNKGGLAADAVGQRPADEQRGDDAEHVGAEQAVDGHLREVAGLAVHDQQRGELVAAPRDGDHGRGHGEPGAGGVGGGS